MHFGGTMAMPMLTLTRHAHLETWCLVVRRFGDPHTADDRREYLLSLRTDALTYWRKWSTAAAAATNALFMSQCASAFRLLTSIAWKSPSLVGVAIA
jgi:hypothetical protein